MSRIVLAWELGGDYGHLYRFLVLARELRARGHEPVMVLRDLALTERVLGPGSFPVYQAPVWLGSVSGLPPPAGFVETLMRFGFLDAGMLLGMLRAWRNLIAALGADLVVCDYAPTALLALRGLAVSRALFGTGFGIPPDSQPMPPYQWWQPPPQARLQDSERKVVAVANTALSALGAPPLTRLGDLLEADERFLCVFPELDHYPGRDDGEFLGGIFEGATGIAPAWPGAGGRRVFAYLKPAYEGFDRVLATLTRVDADLLIHAPGISDHAIRSHQSARVAFSAALIDMEATRQQCDAAVCHAGLGTTSAMLQAGKPLLLLPSNLEQQMTAKRVEALGAGIAVSSTAAKRSPDYGRLLLRLLDDPQYTAHAAEFKARHADYRQADNVRAIAARCEALAASSGRRAAGTS